MHLGPLVLWKKIGRYTSNFAIINPSYLWQMQPTWCAQMNQKIVVTYTFKYNNVGLRSISKSIERKTFSKDKTFSKCTLVIIQHAEILVFNDIIILVTNCCIIISMTLIIEPTHLCIIYSSLTNGYSMFLTHKK